MVYDIFRFVLISMWLWIAGQTVFVIRYYYAARRGIKKGTAPGLLPKHVWLIGLSYLVLSGSAVFRHLDHLGEGAGNLLPYLPVNLVGLAMGIYALHIMMSFQRSRVHTRRGVYYSARVERETLVNLRDGGQFEERRKNPWRRWYQRRGE